MFGAIFKAVMFIAGLVGIAAQAKARGASTAEAIAETAAGLVTGGAALQMRPLAMGKPPETK